MTIETLPQKFTVCKLTSQPASLGEFCFFAHTDGELSLVCPTELTPLGTTAREDGWCGMRVVGTLDFSLIGILAKIADILARAEVSIFAASTFDTDYIFVRSDAFDRALSALRDGGYDVI